MSYLTLMNELDWMQRQMNRTLGALGVSQSSDGALSYSFPRVVLREQPDQLEIKAYLPGTDADAMEITLERNKLTIAGERNSTPPDGSTCRRQERQSGHFERTIELPVEIEHDGITSKLEDGILTINLPKAAQAKLHRIAING